MKRRAYLSMLGVVLASASRRAEAEEAGQVRIARAGSQPSLWGSEEYFSGSVRIDPLFPVTSPSRTSGASVVFEPGARTLWHTHPLGQTLIITEGLGWLQRWGQAVDEVKPGDVVWIPPGVKHWHGATPGTGMTHVALQDHLDGRSAVWMEEVSEAQYRR